jgi:hypothetical protein
MLDGKHNGGHRAAVFCAPGVRVENRDMTLPDFLPTISAGPHDADDGEACVMEYVSLLAGEHWSDRPSCTHPLLAHEARTANDLLLDRDRARLVPLIGRLFGTSEDSDEIRARLRLRQAHQVLLLVEPNARGSVLALVQRAASWLGRTDGSEDEVSEAFATARAYPVRSGGLDAGHEEFHVLASRIAWFTIGTDTGPAEAWALAALTAAHRTAAAECRADCGDSAARARRMVKDLGGLIDEHDAATGRPRSDVSIEDVQALSAAVA